MYSPGPERGPLNRQERCIYVVFLLAILGLFVAEVCINYEPVKLSVLLFVVLWFPLLALHEAGHAIVAAILGWQVERVVIGMGRKLGQFELGTAEIEFRLLPLEGFVRAVPKSLACPSLKHALIYLAGPGIELALVGAIVWGIGPARLFEHSDEYAMIFWQSLAAASATGAIINLIPGAVQTQSGIIPNDGLGFLQSLVRPASAYAEWVAAYRSQQECAASDGSQVSNN